MNISYELKKNSTYKKPEEAIIISVYNNLSLSGMLFFIFQFSYDPCSFS